MKKGLTIALAIATVALLAGSVATRLDSVWAEVFGLFGLLIVVFCVGVVFAAWAMEEVEREKNR